VPVHDTAGYEANLSDRPCAAQDSRAASQGSGRDRVKLRFASSLDDIGSTVALARAVHAESAWSDYEFLPERRERFLARAIEQPQKYCLIIAERDTKPVGLPFASVEGIYHCDATVASCLGVAVDPALRRGLAGGGIAIKLIHGFKRWAGERGAQAISLHVTSGMEMARTDKLLRRLGFQQTGGNYLLKI